MWSPSFPSILKHATYLQAKAIYFIFFVAILHFLLPISILEWAMLCDSNKQRHTFNEEGSFIFHSHNQTHHETRRLCIIGSTTRMDANPAVSDATTRNDAKPAASPPKGKSSSGRHSTDNQIGCPQKWLCHPQNHQPEPMRSLWRGKDIWTFHLPT